MKPKIGLLLLIPLLSSCGNPDRNSRTIFLSAKFVLVNAMFNQTYKPSSDPPYFNRIQNGENCKELFDTKKSYAIYNVKMVDGKPVGYGSLNISFIDKTIADKSCDYFEYICDYDKIYGGVINQTPETKIDFVGVQSCRMHYSWVRMECWFPEIQNGRRIILEYYVTEYYDEPAEFDYKYNI